jgi:hypothetical protein
MTREEIIKLAQEVGLDKTGTWWAGHPLQFEDFANLVAAAERKACKAIADQYAWSPEAKFIAAKIQDRA